MTEFMILHDACVRIKGVQIFERELRGVLVQIGGGEELCGDLVELLKRNAPASGFLHFCARRANACFQCRIHHAKLYARAVTLTSRNKKCAQPVRRAHL